MKKALLVCSVLLCATAVSAQNLSLGGRYSNYSTEIQAVQLLSLETGRESSLGILGQYRNGSFEMNWNFDHDFEGGVSFDFLPIDFAVFSRDRAEFAAGFAPIPYLDVEFGARIESITFGGRSFFGDRFFDEIDMNHQAILFGVNAHSPTIRPVGWYASGRVYLGSADLNIQGVELSPDTAGIKIEGGIPIPVGLSGWEVVPGLEFEHLETDDKSTIVSNALELDTNRFFINFVYNFGR